MPKYDNSDRLKTVGDKDWCEALDELPNMDAGGSVLNGEIALDETCFKEVAHFRVCPREGIYGIQVPKMAWHTLEVHEPSTIFESKDGAYAPLGPEEVRG